VQAGLGQRDSRRNQRGAADLKALQPVAAEEGAEAAAADAEVDLSKVPLPGDAAVAVEGEPDAAAAAAKRRPARRKVAVKAE
jgi:hypothetical protein